MTKHEEICNCCYCQGLCLCEECEKDKGFMKELENEIE